MSSLQVKQNCNSPYDMRIGQVPAPLVERGDAFAITLQANDSPVLDGRGERHRGHVQSALDRLADSAGKNLQSKPELVRRLPLVVQTSRPLPDNSHNCPGQAAPTRRVPYEPRVRFVGRLAGLRIGNAIRNGCM